MTSPPRPLASKALEDDILLFLALDNQINTIEEQLKDLKAQRKVVGEDDITNEAKETEVVSSGVRLSDGTEFVFEEKLSCGIKVEDRAAAYAWLEAHMVGHLLKRRVTIQLGNDSAELAAWLVQKLEATPSLSELPVTIERELPGSTLTAFVKKCQKAGVNLPPAFNVYAPLKPVRVSPTPAEDAAQSAALTEQLEASLKP